METTTTTPTASQLADALADLDYVIGTSIAHPNEVTGLVAAVSESWLWLGNLNKTEDGKTADSYAANCHRFHRKAWSLANAAIHGE